MQVSRHSPYAVHGMCWGWVGIDAYFRLPSPLHACNRTNIAYFYHANVLIAKSKFTKHATICCTPSSLSNKMSTHLPVAPCRSDTLPLKKNNTLSEGDFKFKPQLITISEKAINTNQKQKSLGSVDHGWPALRNRCVNWRFPFCSPIRAY